MTELTPIPQRHFEMGMDTPESQEYAQYKMGCVYVEMLELLSDYVDLPINEQKVIVIWIIGTYFHKEFETYPFLFINAMRGSGKTRLLRLISYLQKDGEGSVENHVSEAVLFRTAAHTGLMLDEMEGLGGKEKGTLRELLNQAYKKGGRVRRMRKAKVNGQEAQVVEEFPVYTPLAIANIMGLDEVLADRAITIILEKSNNPKVTKMIEDFEKNEKIINIKRTLNQIRAVLSCRWLKIEYRSGWNRYLRDKYVYNIDTTTYTTTTTLNYTTTSVNTPLDHEQLEFYNKVDELGINGRNFELVYPLLSIARSLSYSVFEEFLTILKEIIAFKREDEMIESKDVSLLEFVSRQTEYQVKEVPVIELTREFRSFLGEMDEEDRWLNPKWMGKALKRLVLISSKRRINSGRLVTLNVAKAKEKIKMFKSGEELQDAKQKLS